MAAAALRRQTLKVGAVCPNWARTDLCGGGWQQPSLPRMTASRDDAACTGAVVRKPPVKETAIGGTCGGAAGFDLSGLDRCRRDPPEQLLRYGTKIAIGIKRLWHPV